MFNFDKIGQKIAQIQGGKKDKEFVYLSDGKEPVKNGYDEIKLDDGAIMQPLPNKKIVEKVYVSGTSGSGKSVYTGKWLKQLHKMDKDMPIYLFSPVVEDKALDFLPLERVDMDMHLINNPFTVEELADSVVVFDDCDSIKEPAMKKYISWLRDNLLIRGRHTNTRIVYISHLISNYSDTRNLLNEATSVTVYPRSGGGTYQIKKYLELQCGLDKAEIKRFINLPSRWCTIYRSYPQFVVHEKGCYFPRFD
jgi:hypothetical protein